MIGQKLGSFTLEEKVGSGAMGVVYRAKSEKTGKTAAVKIITTEQSTKTNATERFEREAEILQQFRHPNIVRFLAVGKAKGTKYFAMEFVEGKTLDDVLLEREFMPWQEVVSLGLQMCQALHYAHQRGVVHRDLKPSNLMITADGTVKLTDFGIAKDLDATALTAPGRTLGTAAYMAPEQIRGTPEVSHKTDIYSLGCVLYQMITGQTPFKGSSAVALMHMHLNEPPPRPSEKNPEIPKALDDVIVAMMGKKPSERPWDAEAIETVLEEIKQRLDKGESVALVRAPDVLPSRMGSMPDAAGDLSTGARRSDGGSQTRKRAKSAAKEENADPWAPPRMETTLLILGLCFGVALLAYLLWPTSAATLYREAEKLMASEKSSDWAIAETDFISELEKRFPTKYPDQIHAWRDKIALDKAKRRAVVLETSAVAALREPKNDAERDFSKTSAAAAEAMKLGMEPDARKMWNELAGVFKDAPDNRGWFLLAAQRAEQLEATITGRAKELADRLDQADKTELQGKYPLAAQLRQRLLDDFGKYPYLKGLLERASSKLPKIELPPTERPGENAEPGESEPSPSPEP